MKINLKEFVDTKEVTLEELSIKTALPISILRNMYYKGVFDGDEVGVQALSELTIALNISNINELVPEIN